MPVNFTEPKTTSCSREFQDILNPEQGYPKTFFIFLLRFIYVSENCSCNTKSFTKLNTASERL